MDNKNIKVILGNNVKYYRFLLNKTQEELAEICDLSPRYVSDIENGKGNISIDTLENIAKCLKVDTYLLIKDKQHKELPKRVNMK